MDLESTFDIIRKDITELKIAIAEIKACLKFLTEDRNKLSSLETAKNKISGAWILIITAVPIIISLIALLKSLKNP